MPYRDDIHAIRTELRQAGTRLAPIAIDVGDDRAALLLGRAVAMTRAVDRLLQEALSRPLNQAPAAAMHAEPPAALHPFAGSDAR